MGFFEFDSVLPERRNRPAGSSNQPVNASSVFDFGQEEDLAVYTWGEDTYDGLGDKLLEDDDDFNDDTFGGGDSGPVDRNFDFSGQTARMDDRVKPVYKTTPVAPLRSSSAPKTTTLLPQKSSTSKIKGRIPIAGSLEDLWADSPSPTKVPVNQSGATFDGKGDVWGTPTRSDSYSRGMEGAGRTAFSSFDEPPVQQQLQQRHKTLEEIEAEMMGFASSKPRPLTMEEIEREMMSGAGGGGSHPHHGYNQASPFVGHPQPIALQQQQQQQQHSGFPAIPSHFSPHPHQQLPHGGFPHGQHPQGSPFPAHQQAQPLHSQQHGSPFPGQAHPQSIQQQQIQPSFQGVAGNIIHTPQGSPFVGHAQPHLLQSQQQAHIQHQQQNLLGFPNEIDSQQTGSNQGPPGLGPGPLREQGIAGAFNLSEMFPALPGQKDAPVAASTDLLGALVGSNEQEQAFVKEELERKIREQERADERRMRKARKIASMAQYNDIMTRSDKDFITRIQVSQLVTQDPYADDFYAQVYGAILRSKLGAPHGPATVVQLTQDGMGVGVGVGGPGNGVGGVGMNRMGRKEGAMQKMAAQVKRIVDAAKQRETTKAGAHLEGVLGKTTVRSAKTAPRPMLQASYSSTDAKVDASKTNGEPIDPNQHQGQPLNRRETLIAIEQLYDVILKLEQLRRNSPPAHLFSDEEDVDPQDKERALEWQKTYKTDVEELWTKLKVDLPVDHSFPHPFISILGPLKGKKLFPRLLRHLNPSQVLTVFTLLLACFSQIDVVWDAPPPLPPYTREQAAREKDTDAFLSSVIPAFLSVLDKCELRMVAGMVGLVVQRCNVVQIAKTRPGVVLLTVLLSRAEVLKHGTAEQSPDPSDIQQWQQAFDGLFVRIASYLPTVFPSANVSSAFVPQLYMAKNHGGIDLLDMPVWQMLSSFALHANMDQQQTLVAELRDKVIEGVVAAKQGWVDEETAVRKVANVDLFLHALGLDSGMITG